MRLPKRLGTAVAIGVLCLAGSVLAQTIIRPATVKRIGVLPYPTGGIPMQESDYFNEDYYDEPGGPGAPSGGSPFHGVWTDVDSEGVIQSSDYDPATNSRLSDGVELETVYVCASEVPIYLRDAGFAKLTIGPGYPRDPVDTPTDPNDNGDTSYTGEPRTRYRLEATRLFPNEFDKTTYEGPKHNGTWDWEADTGSETSYPPSVSLTLGDGYYFITVRTYNTESPDPDYSYMVHYGPILVYRGEIGVVPGSYAASEAECCSCRFTTQDLRNGKILDIPDNPGDPTTLPPPDGTNSGTLLIEFLNQPEGVDLEDLVRWAQATGKIIYLGTDGTCPGDPCNLGPDDEPGTGEKPDEVVLPGDPEYPSDATGVIQVLRRYYRLVSNCGGEGTEFYEIAVVRDTVPPQIKCPPDDQLVANQDCNAILPDYTGDATADDNCDTDVDITQDPLPGTAIGLGDTIVTLTATDDAGNSDTCTFTVTVVDETDPTIDCPPDDTVDADDNCEALLGDYTGDAVVDDNCDPRPVVTQDPLPGTVIVGSQQVCLTVTDGTGNSATCCFTVTVEDNTDPTIDCPPDDTVPGDANCEALLGDYTGDATVDDNCDPQPGVTQDPLPGTVISGTQRVCLTVTDASGNSATCCFTVTVEDNTNPTIDCPPNDTVDGDENCQAVLRDYTGDATVDDNCDPQPVVTQDPPAGEVISGTQTVCLTVTDASGNSATCCFEVTVQDNTDPTIDCPPNDAVDADENCEAVLGDYTGDATVDDNCDPDVTVTQDPAPGTILGLGDTLVTLTATDDAGNSDSCTFTVTVEDNTDPTIDCPPNETVDADENCEAVLGDYTGDATVDDNCDSDVAVTQDPAPGTILGLGDTLVTLTATDDSGNSASCTFTVTVEDNTNPTIDCPPDDTVDGDANCEAVLGDYTGDATVDDNCDPQPIVTQDPLPGTVIVGSQQVCLTVTDASGNSATCCFTVTVEDNTDPTIDCPPNDTVDGDENCEAVLGDYSGDAIVDDNCDPQPVVTQDPLPGTVIVGSQQVCLTVTDASGNSATCCFTVTVEDNTDPTIDCPPNDTVDADENCEAILGDYTGDATVDDNCDPDVDVTQDPVPGTILGLGDTLVTLTATDDAGNSASCTFTVTVEDNTDPSIDCPPDDTVDADENCEAVLGDYTGDATVDDNCDPDVDVTQDPAPGTTLGLGATTVTLTATDDAGNSASCTFTVTVEDNTDPSIDCPPDDTVDADENCEATLGDYTGDARVDDNCDPDVDVTQDPPPGTTIPVGDTTVTLTATDDEGNSANCSFTVTVEDNSHPEITFCPPDQVRQTDGADCLYTIEDFGATAEDNCDGPLDGETVVNGPGVVDAEIGDSIGPGSYVVTITFTDAAGNSAVCEFGLTVEPIPLEVICWEPGEDEFVVPVDPATCTGVLPDFCQMLEDEGRILNPCGSSVECSQMPPAGTSFAAGEVVDVTITVTDLGARPPVEIECRVTVRVQNVLWIDTLECDEDMRPNCPIIYHDTDPVPVAPGNIVRVVIWYACEPLQELLFTVNFDPNDFEYLDSCRGSRLGEIRRDGPFDENADMGIVEGDGLVGIYIDSPAGECRIQPVPGTGYYVAGLWFRVKEGATVGQSMSLAVQYADGCNGLPVPIVTDDSDAPVVGDCVKDMDVDRDGCVDEVDGLIIYRTMKYVLEDPDGVWAGLVPIIPDWIRADTCFPLPDDLAAFDNVIQLSTGPRNPGFGLDVDGDSVERPARDGINVYRHTKGEYGDDTVPAEHEADPVDPVDETFVNGRLNALETTNCNGLP